MALYQNYPYTDMQTLNLDGVLRQVKTNTDNIESTAQDLSEETAARVAADANLQNQISALDPESQVPRIIALEKDAAEEKRRRSAKVGRFFAHQGLSASAPGNSLPAIRLAAASGFNAAEIDVQITKDNVCVLNHDMTLEAYGSSAAIADLNYSAISEMQRVTGVNLSLYGTMHIARIEDACRAARESGIMLCVDIGYSFGTDEDTAREKLPYLVAAINDSAYQGNVFYIGAYDFYGDILKELAPGAFYGMYQTRDFNSDALVATAAEHGFEMIGMPYSYVNRALCELAHSYGLLVYSFTYTAFMISDEYAAGADCFGAESMSVCAPRGNAFTNDAPVYATYMSIVAANKAEADRLGKPHGFVWHNNTSPYKYPQNYNQLQSNRVAMLTPEYCDTSHHESYWIDAGYQLSFIECSASGAQLAESGWIGGSTGTGGIYTPTNSDCSYLLCLGRKVNDGVIAEYELDYFSRMLHGVY